MTFQLNILTLVGCRNHVLFKCQFCWSQLLYVYFLFVMQHVLGGKENSNPPTNKQQKGKSRKVTVTEKKKRATGRKKNNSSPTKSSNKQRKRKSKKVKVKDNKKRATGTIIIASDPPRTNYSPTPPSQPSFSQGSSSGSEPVRYLTPSRHRGGGHGLKSVEQNSNKQWWEANCTVTSVQRNPFSEVIRLSTWTSV